MCPRCPAITAGAFVEAALKVLWRSPPWSPTWPLSWPVPMAAWSTCWTQAVASGPSHCPTSSGWSIIWPTCWRSCWRWNWTFAMSWRPPRTGWQRCALWTMCIMDSRCSSERFRRWDCHRKIRFKFCDLRFSPDYSFHNHFEIYWNLFVKFRTVRSRRSRYGISNSKPHWRRKRTVEWRPSSSWVLICSTSTSPTSSSLSTSNKLWQTNRPRHHRPRLLFLTYRNCKWSSGRMTPR